MDPRKEKTPRTNRERITEADVARILSDDLTIQE